MASTSTTVTTHPRRRSARSSGGPSMTPSLIDSFQKMSLRKGDTFHSPPIKPDNDFWDPFDTRSPSMPARSTTCPTALEDLLFGAGERRVADLIARVDKAVETNSKLALGAILNDPEVLPHPSSPTPSGNKTPTKRHTRATHSHESDSGIGTSVADSTEAVTDKDPTETEAIEESSSDSQSLASISAASEKRGLSKYACEQIHKHIVEPILHEEALKDFHPLIQDVPRKIGNKDIKTLRDLEKSLIFLAPDFAFSPTKYLRFCERTIRVLHTTVTTLHESDQKAPTDRAYTQGYFCDLVEQIRRYATILAATRAKQAKGKKLDEMDFSPDETVSLTGGVTHNGKAPELVRHKAQGKAISVATGHTLSPEDVASSSSSMKRPMVTDVADNDEVLRSMARRKKGAKPEIHECPLCDKEFKRPCDLTKHVKTHERPWKCPEAKCKYHDHGWPTEKERDRHVNDKHSTAPALYHCLYKPCPYTSKRESNCKQHMEKAHGWDYIRSKSNGKGKLPTTITHLTKGSVPASPASAMMTPLTPIAPSPSGYTASNSSSSRRESLAPANGVPVVAGPSTWNTTSPRFVAPSPDFAGHFNMNFDFNNMATSTFPMTPALSADDAHRRDSMSISNFDGSSYEPSPDLDFDTNFNFNDFQFHPTPNSAAGVPLPIEPASAQPSIDTGYSSAGLTSPDDLTFTSPHFDTMQLDEGFGGDFTLFASTGNATTHGAEGLSSGNEMFPDIGDGGSWMNEYTGAKGMGGAPALTSDNSVLAELFPGLGDR